MTTSGFTSGSASTAWRNGRSEGTATARRGARDRTPPPPASRLTWTFPRPCCAPQFRALSEQLYRTEDFHADIRERAVTWMEQHPVCAEPTRSRAKTP